MCIIIKLKHNVAGLPVVTSIQNILCSIRCVWTVSPNTVSKIDRFISKSGGRCRKYLNTKHIVNRK